MKRRIWSVLLIACLSVIVLAGFSKKTSALSASEITGKMNQLKNSYPSDTYWNHKAGDSYDGYYVTNTRCGVNGYTCNELYGGKQCYAFARHIAYLLFGSYPQNVSMFSDGYVDSNGWTCVRDPSKVTLEPGDYVRGDGHSGIVWYVSGENVYVAQCFGGEKSGCKLNWGTFWGDSESKTLSEILSKNFVGVWKHPGSTGTTVPVYPSKPVLTGLKASYAPGETITFINWAPSTNATHYNVTVEQQYENGEYKQVWAKLYASITDGATVQLAVPATYRARVQAVNANSYLSEPVDGSNWPITYSDYVYFTVSEPLNITKKVRCAADITVKPNITYYRNATATTASAEYTADTSGENGETVHATGYIELSNGEQRFYFNRRIEELNLDAVYYVPIFYLEVISWKHTYGEASSEHPHYRTCECGSQKATADKNCYICYPARIEYKSDRESIYGEKYIPDPQEGGPTILVTNHIPEGYGTFLGWKQDGLDNLVMPGDSVQLVPGETKVLKAVWELPTNINFYHGIQIKSSVLNSGNGRFFEIKPASTHEYKFICTDTEEPMIVFVYRLVDGKRQEIVGEYMKDEAGGELISRLTAGETYAIMANFRGKSGNFTLRVESTGIIVYTDIESKQYTVLAREADGSHTIAGQPFERDGYEFLGWAKDENATSATYHAGDSVHIEADEIWKLFAVWKKESNHTHTMAHHTRKAATCLNAGTVEYWLCTDCGKYYLDANAANETTAEKTILPALGHNYVNGTCTRCSAKDPNAAEPDPNAAVVSVAPVRGKAGETVEIAVTLANNPGFSDLSIEIGYDASVMELTKVTPNSAVGCNFTTSQQLIQLPYMLNWVEGTKNNTFTGTLVTLMFQIKESAALGSYPVTVSYYKGKFGNNIDGVDVNYDQDDNRVPIIYVNGSVTVYSYTPGDLNDDGRINSKDVICLLRYIAGWELDGLVEDALDVNHDGRINSKDAILLLRYIANWDVKLY